MNLRVFLNSVAAASVLAAMAILIEIAIRIPYFTEYLATRPVDIVTQSANNVRLAALSRIENPRVAVVGDSVGLGQIMSTFGVANWQDSELSSALSDQLDGFTVSNLSGNGLRAADYAQSIEDALAVGVDSIVLILGARAFSSDFEQLDRQHAHEWRSKAYSAPSLQARGVAEFVVTDAIGAPLGGLLTRIRMSLKGKQEVGTLDPVAVLRFRQRLIWAEFDDENGKQAGALAAAFRQAKAEEALLIIVYPTENPDMRDQVVPGPIRQRNMEQLQAFVARTAPQAIFLGPDTTMRGQDYVDHMHPNPDGYRAMASRIAPIVKASYGQAKADR